MAIATCLGAISLYLLGFQIQLRRFRKDSDTALNLWIVAAAILLHGAAGYHLVVGETGINLGLLVVSAVVAFVMVAVVALTNLRLPIDNLYLFLFPISVATLLAATFIGGGSSVDIDAALLPHILLSLAAYSALMLAACQSILLAYQERQLKAPGGAVRALLPPLETMERLLVAMLWIGLALLSAAILSGWLFLDDLLTPGAIHHTVLTSLSWLAYVAFLAGRYFFGWRGVTAVRWTLVAFGLLVLGYLGTKFVLEYMITQ